MPQANVVGHSPQMLKQSRKNLDGLQQHLGPMGTPLKAAESAGVPSTGAMMSSTSTVLIPPSYCLTTGSGGRNDHQSFISAADGPLDIPTEKIKSAGEDMRALDQLDRFFTQ